MWRTVEKSFTTSSTPGKSRSSVVKPYRGTISRWWKMYAPVEDHYYENQGLGYRIVGTFDTYPHPGIKGLTAFIVREDGDLVETEHSIFKLEGGWHESQEFLLRWKELCRHTVYSLSRAARDKYRRAQRKKVPPMFAPGGPLHMPE